MSEPLWKNKKDGFRESLAYMRGRKDGSITSFKTSWKKFNDATTDGIEFNSITVIGGRPASGKTLLIEQMIREGFDLNPKLNHRVLQFQFEMVSRTSAIREYSSFLGKSYKYFCSADGKLSDEDWKKCHEYAKSRSNLPIDVVDTPLTVNEIEELIYEYMNYHAIKTENSFEYVKTIITLDHSILVKRAPFEKSVMETLYNLGEALTRMKKKYPIAFIILTQLNRSVDDPERCENGKYGNYILTSDIFGSDSLLMHADTVVAINRPAVQKIKFYGPDKYIIEDENTLVLHFLKCRNGGSGMSFFKAVFDKMRIEEMNTPNKRKMLEHG